MNAGEPALGWFMLSEADRSAAERYLSKLASDGTRDELGFAPIHFAFADRFFPGTSVQHAQLRYVFFVAWTYQELLEATAGERFSRDRLCEIEERFSRRLMLSVPELQNSGISGWMKYQAGARPVVRASTIYWSALRTWRVAQPTRGGAEPPTEADLQRRWPQLATFDEGDKGLKSISTIFDDLPAPPADWNRRRGQLDFALRKAEAAYIRRLWKMTWRGLEPPLLSKLTEAGVSTDSLYSSAVRAVASQAEREALVLAEQAAALACIARGVHSALVEAKRNDDRGTTDRLHADALPRLISEYETAALALDLGRLRQATGIDDRLARFIDLVMRWLQEKRPFEALSKAIATREHELKGARAYLANAKRRADWRKGVAVPLDYRWPTVRHMIDRVREAA